MKYLATITYPHGPVHTMIIDDQIPGAVDEWVIYQKKVVSRGCRIVVEKFEPEQADG